MNYHKKRALRSIGFICAFCGTIVLFYVMYPILKYEVTSPRFASFLSPVPEGAGLVYANDNFPDYTKASNWFDADDFQEAQSSSVKYFTISIPRLKIKGAAVAIGGEDLSESLIQYPSTALPGKRGNAVIFGHSVLPQFFNPKDYLTIFSTLPTLEEGDHIYVNYDGVSYSYQVEDMFEVQPTDLQVLEQNTSDSFLTLITCAPPGHPLRPRRLVVRARVTTW